MQGRDSHPRRAAYEAAARPLSYPAKYRRRDSNPHGPVAHDGLSVARMHSATAARMALAGIEPATRWISPSRSTGELQEPSLWRRSRRDSNPHPPERQSGALPLRYGSRNGTAMARTNDAPTRESRSRMRTPSAVGHDLTPLHTCIHRLSKSVRSLFSLPVFPSRKQKRPTRHVLRRWGEPLARWSRTLAAYGPRFTLRPCIASIPRPRPPSTKARRSAYTSPLTVAWATVRTFALCKRQSRAGMDMRKLADTVHSLRQEIIQVTRNKKSRVSVVVGGRPGSPPQPTLLVPCGTALDRRPLGRDSRSSAHTVQMNWNSRKTPLSSCRGWRHGRTRRNFMPRETLPAPCTRVGAPAPQRRAAGSCPEPGPPLLRQHTRWDELRPRRLWLHLGQRPLRPLGTDQGRPHHVAWPTARLRSRIQFLGPVGQGQHR